MTIILLSKIVSIWNRFFQIDTLAKLHKTTVFCKFEFNTGNISSIYLSSKRKAKIYNSTPSVICQLPPSSLHCRSYDKGCEPLYLVGLGPLPCTGRRCLAPLPSTKTSHLSPERCHSLGICWNDVDMPDEKQCRPPHDWDSNPVVQPPCSIALPQKHAPSAVYLSRPIAPTAEEHALHLQG